MNNTDIHNFRHIFLMNSNTSRKAVKQKLVMDITNVCEEEALNYEIFWTRLAREAVEHVKSEALKNDRLRVYICGGDGSVNSILNGTWKLENVEFGVIPIGSGNDFARSIAPLEMLKDVRKVVFSDTIKADLIAFNDRICVNMINIGFDEKVVSYVQKKRKHVLMRCSFAYTFSALVQLLSMPKEHTRITFNDGTIIDRPFLLSAIANGAYCGGGYNAASNSSINDGLIDVLVVKPINRLAFVNMLGDYRKGTLLNTPKGKQIIYQKKCTSVTMEKDTEFELCLDGDIILTKYAKCSIIPKAFNLITPEKGKN